MCCMGRSAKNVASAAVAFMAAAALCSCDVSSSTDDDSAVDGAAVKVYDIAYEEENLDSSVEIDVDGSDGRAEASDAPRNFESLRASPEEFRARLSITQDCRESFAHGEKGASFQKYIVLHDTEGESDASGVVNYWDSTGSGVAAHFVVNRDGSIVQCVPLDSIAHHAGFGDTGNNALYGVEDESRDDKKGTVPIGDWAADYGMNSYSIGIEMVHVGGSGDYPEAQLEALDGLIAYIDAYYGFESAIIDHKAWRTGNSDTSPEFASYLVSYQKTRTHE